MVEQALNIKAFKGFYIISVYNTQSFKNTAALKMNIDIIAKFCETKKLPAGNCIRIDFKKRESLFGFIIQGTSYEDLKSKNFWRFVIHSKMHNWEQTGDMDMTRIYNGSEFKKLSVVGIKEHLSVI